MTRRNAWAATSFRIAWLACALAASGCYLSHDTDTAPRPGDRYGVFTFTSCTGSGEYTMILLCEDGRAQVRRGMLGAHSMPDTAGWDLRDEDPDRVEVQAVRGGIWQLRWDADRGTWIDERPIDTCAEPGRREPELSDELRALAMEMRCEP